MRICLVFIAFFVKSLLVNGQKSYTPNSVLGKGKWIKISTSSAGIYKVTSNQLKAAGFSGNISSEKLRLFGNGGGILPESNSAWVQDDLAEVSIELSDGGDGIFDGNDYFIFHSPGAHQWIFDEKTKQYRFQKNFYSNKSYYFVQLSELSGLRISSAPVLSNPVRQVTTFYEHYHQELDSISFLRSGKEWYGEDFSNQNGRKSVREFQVATNAVAGQKVRVVSDLIGRSFAQSNRMPVSLNGVRLFDHQTLPLVGSILEPAANPNRQEGEALIASNSISLSYQFNGSGINAEAWLNWFDVHYTRNLDMQGLKILSFRDTSLMLPGNTAEYRISNPAANSIVWDITNPLKPRKVTVQAGNPLKFVQDIPFIKEYLVFDPSQIPLSVVEGEVANQDLHATGPQDMVIVTDPLYMEQAERLAEFHRQKQGLRVLTVDPGKIFNEFSSGTPDPSAIRNFLKMLYDKAGSDIGKRPRFLLLFGTTSYIQNENSKGYGNKVPSYQSESSLDPLTSYVTDDFFGFLDDNEDINRNSPSPMLDIGIGRIPARNLMQATTVVNKILNYHSIHSFGSWRNNITLVADDEDYNLHLNDAELHSALIGARSPAWNLQKIYLDGFVQEGGTSGSFYPAVNTTITNGINRGTLLWNYSGHGGSSRLAQEAILDKKLISVWNNSNRLPLFITATCDFAPFDDLTQFSLGEDLLMTRSSGAIGLMTTTRLVFASSNRVINNNFLNSMLSRNSKGEVPALGSALMEAKNFTVQNSGDFVNARKFIMLGDPAMKIGIPEYNVRAISLNGKSIAGNPDTIRATEEYELKGEILKPDGTLASDFNGDVYSTLYDKPSTLKTLANDPQSRAVDYPSSDVILHNGMVKAQNGQFSFKFTAPRDMDLRMGNGRISFYANNEKYDAAGGTQKLVVGGLGNNMTSDKQGPILTGYLDTISFRNGDLVRASPMLYVDLSDASGINLTGSLGHEIIAVIDGDKSGAIILNGLFTPAPEKNSGSIVIQLPFLSAGKHTVAVRAWDVFNNSATLTLDFKVNTFNSILISKLQCIPNPVSGKAIFKAEIDGPTDAADVQLTIFALGGQAVKSFRSTINEPSLRSLLIEWDGKDDRGNALGTAVYAYMLQIKTREGILSRKHGKIIVQ